MCIYGCKATNETLKRLKHKEEHNVENIKNVQEAYDIELTEEELDQVQGGVAPVIVAVAMAATLGWVMRKVRFPWLRK